MNRYTNHGFNNQNHGFSPPNDAWGAWPGDAAEGTEVINGVTYEEWTVPTDLEGKSENLINNNGISQLADFPVTLDKDYYLAAWSTD